MNRDGEPYFVEKVAREMLNEHNVKVRDLLAVGVACELWLRKRGLSWDKSVHKKMAFGNSIRRSFNSVGKHE